MPSTKFFTLDSSKSSSADAIRQAFFEAHEFELLQFTMQSYLHKHYAVSIYDNHPVGYSVVENGGAILYEYAQTYAEALQWVFDNCECKA
jgi:hypothetical protein